MTSEHFRDLFETYKRPLVNYLRLLVMDGVHAEELASQIFFALNAKKVFADDKMTFWNFARTYALTVLRRHSELVPESDLDLLPVHEGSDPSLEALKKASKEVIRKSVSHLTVAQRDAVGIKLFSGLDAVSMSSVLGISNSEAQLIFSRAKLDILDGI